MRFLRIFSRVIIGLLFIFSGCTKAIDPVGFGFVMTEYLKALGLDFLCPLAVTGGILMSAFEFVLGVSILVGLQLRLASIFSMFFMLFFTFFTLWIAIYNPVHHCGCFGDAVILSNWATFYKNLIFTPLTVLLFVQRKHFPPISFKIREWGAMVMFGMASVLLSLHGYRHLPLIDFTGFKVGNHIPEAMTDKRQYETVFTYKKGAETKTFTLAHLPDSTWTYHDHKNLVTGVAPQIVGFEISAYQENRYVTDSVLSIKGPLLVLTVPYAEKANAKAVEKADALYRQVAENTNIPMMVLSGTPEEGTKQWGMATPVYFSDPKTLYTMVRANPGLMLWYDANVVAKWSAYDIPSYPQLARILDQDWEVVSAKSSITEHLSVEFLAVILMIVLAVCYPVFRRHVSKRP